MTNLRQLSEHPKVMLRFLKFWPQMTEILGEEEGCDDYDTTHREI